MVKVVTVLGARPQFIKAAAVSRILRSKKGIKEYIIHTGQHYDANMSDVFFQELELPEPDINLGVGSASHAVQTAHMLEGIEHVLLEQNPDTLLVYGDTNSTLAGALAAAKLHVPCVHVEAGLRSFNRRMPEEINRILTDHVSDILMAPTETAVNNLVHEGINSDRIILTGDVMYDATLFYHGIALSRKDLLRLINVDEKSYILVTIHRAENTDNISNLESILSGLIEVTKELPVVWPLHPRTRSTINNTSLWEKAKSVINIIDPVGYLDMILLESCSKLIITDSGGVQKEAFFNQVPCITIRDETEWIELINCGWNKLVPPDRFKEFPQVALEFIKESNGLVMPTGLYGNGDAAKKVVESIIHLLGTGR